MSTENKETTPKVAKKGTAQTEAVIGTAAANIKKSLAELANAVKTVESLGEKADTYQGVIAEREEKIKALDIQFAEAKRQKQVELDLKIKEDERKVVADVLAKQNLVAVDSKDLSDMRNTLDKQDRDVQSEVNKAVGAATGAMKKDHENAIALRDANILAQEAQNKAKIETLESQVDFLTKQVDMWKNALDAERIAGTERSKSSAVGTINLGNQGKS